MANIEFDGRLFSENVAKLPRNELLRFAGRYVAWTLDGTKILADAADEAALFDRLDTAGIAQHTVAIDYVPAPDE